MVAPGDVADLDPQRRKADCVPLVLNVLADFRESSAFSVGEGGGGCPFLTIFSGVLDSHKEGDVPPSSMATRTDGPSGTLADSDRYVSRFASHDRTVDFYKDMKLDHGYEWIKVHLQIEFGVLISPRQSELGPRALCRSTSDEFLHTSRRFLQVWVGKMVD